VRASLENEIRDDREKWAARKKRPRLRKRKARKRIGWDKLGESVRRRGRAKNSSRRDWPRVTFSPYSSIESYVRTYVHTFGRRRICSITLIA